MKKKTTNEARGQSCSLQIRTEKNRFQNQNIIRPIILGSECAHSRTTDTIQNFGTFNQEPFQRFLQDTLQGVELLFFFHRGWLIVFRIIFLWKLQVFIFQIGALCMHGQILLYSARKLFHCRNPYSDLDCIVWIFGKYNVKMVWKTEMTRFSVNSVALLGKNNRQSKSLFILFSLYLLLYLTLTQTSQTGSALKIVFFLRSLQNINIFTKSNCKILCIFFSLATNSVKQCLLLGRRIETINL